MASHTVSKVTVEDGYVRGFADLAREDVAFAGGKGANLGAAASRLAGARPVRKLGPETRALTGGATC